jgi:hypothetical protein
MENLVDMAVRLLLLLLLCLFQPRLTLQSKYAGYLFSFSNKVLLIRVDCRCV